MAAHLKGDEQLLVRLPKWLGDCVMAEPVLSALAEMWRLRGGMERLTFVGPKHLLGLWDARFCNTLEGANLIDSSDASGVREALSQADVALLLTGSLRSAFEVWRAGVPRRIGWNRDLRGVFLTDTMKPMLERGGAPIADTLSLSRAPELRETLPTLGVAGRYPRYAPRPFGSTVIELVAGLGIPVRRTKPSFRATDEVQQRVRGRLREGGVDPEAGFVVLNAGSRPGSAKGWQSWGELVDLIHPKLPVVVVGGPGEESSLQGLRSGLVLDAPVLDLAELTALCADCHCFVTADAGARHIASAAGAQTLVLFGPTDPRHTADHLERTLCLSHPVPCGPCHQEKCTAKDTLACFTGIPARRVATQLDLICEASSDNV